MELDYLSGYEHYLADEKKASANTASSYLRDVRQFSAWLAGRGLDAAQVSQNDVRGYAQYLKGCAKSEATVVRSVASLKSFYSYLVSRRVLAVNPAKGYTPAKVERKLPEILTGKEVELFLEQPELQQSASIGEIWQTMRKNPKNFDPRNYLWSIMPAVTMGEVKDAHVQKVVDCMKDGVTESIAPLLVQFGSYRKSHLIEVVTCEQMAERYKKAGI